MTNSVPIPKPLELVFKHADELDIMMDVYLPATASDECPAPVLMWWHGGGLLQGTRKAICPHMLAAPTKHNLCVVAPDYRLAPQTRFPGILSDCKAALDFLRSPLFAEATGNHVDSSKIVLSGGSAGGWLALLLGTGIGYAACGLELPDPVTGIAALYPITDLLDPFWSTKQRPVSFVGRVVSRGEVEPFVNPDDVKTSWSAVDDKRSVFYSYMVQEGILSSLLLDGTGIPPRAFGIAQNLKSRRFTAPPTYIIHGTIDDIVPIRQSGDVVASLKEINVEVEYHEMEGLNHLFDRDPRYDMASMYEFIFTLVKAR